VFSLVTGFLTPSPPSSVSCSRTWRLLSGRQDHTVLPALPPPYVRTLSRAATGPAPTAACPHVR